VSPHNDIQLYDPPSKIKAAQINPQIKFKKIPEGRDKHTHTHHLTSARVFNVPTASSGTKSLIPHRAEPGAGRSR